MSERYFFTMTSQTDVTGDQFSYNPMEGISSDCMIIARMDIIKASDWRTDITSSHFEQYKEIINAVFRGQKLCTPCWGVSKFISIWCYRKKDELRKTEVRGTGSPSVSCRKYPLISGCLTVLGNPRMSSNRNPGTRNPQGFLAWNTAKDFWALSLSAWYYPSIESISFNLLKNKIKGFCEDYKKRIEVIVYCVFSRFVHILSSYCKWQWNMMTFSSFVK